MTTNYYVTSTATDIYNTSTNTYGYYTYYYPSDTSASTIDITGLRCYQPSVTNYELPAKPKGFSVLNQKQIVC